MNSRNQLVKSIKNLLRGLAHPEEIKKINSWYDNQAEVSPATAGISEKKAKLKEKELLVQLKEKAGFKKEPKSSLYANWKIAASIILFLSLGSLYYLQLLPQPESPATEKWITFENETGMIKKIKLSDGSLVSLYHRTKIQLAENFSTNRTLLLDGQAFFEVEKDSLHPFTVKAAQLETRVLGTSFLIDTQSEGTESVYVKTGLVKVSKGEGISAHIQPNEKAYIDPEGKLNQAIITKPEETFAWTENKLVFKSASMQELVSQLENWYGVKIEVQNPTSPCKISGIYEALSLENTLEVISYSIPIHYQIHEKNVSIQFPNCL